MKNWLKKVLSLLTAIALLVSAGVLAFAEETGEPIDTAAAENAAQNDAEEEAARQAAEEAARKAAEEEAARKAAEEEAARKAAEEAAQKAAEEAARKAAEEEAARKAAEEAARQAAEEAARQAAEEEARKAAEEAAASQNADASEAEDEPVPTYNNDETSETEVPSETEAPAEDEDDDDDSDGEVIEIDGWGYVDPEIIPEYLPEITTEIKFPEATELKLNQAVSGSVDAENKAEYIFVYGSSKTIVLSLNASSEDVKVEINQKAVKLTKDESVTSGYAATCELNVIAGNEYNIVLTSSVPVSYKLIAKDANAAKEENNSESGNTGEAEANEQKEEGRSEQSGSGKPSADLSEGTAATEENSDNANDTTASQETAEEEVPPMTGWISASAGTYSIGDTVTLTAQSDSALGDMVAWQTKVGNEGNWKGAGYGSTLTVELTEENNNSAYRFRMEDGNYSEEYVLTAAAGENGETEEPEETADAVEPEETEAAGDTETEETEAAEQAEEAETEETEAEEQAEDAETEEAEAEEQAEDAETEEAEETEERKVSFSYFWDDEEPSIGSVVHMKATVTGYDNLDYVLQWQYSEDPDTFGWTNYPGANDETFDLQITEENNNFFWRVSVFLDEEIE